MWKLEKNHVRGPLPCNMMYRHKVPDDLFSGMILTSLDLEAICAAVPELLSLLCMHK